MGFEQLNLNQRLPAQRSIAGISCSISKDAPSEAWLAFGIIEGTHLEIRQINKVGLHALTKELAALDSLAAIGLDCPFSVPVDFIAFLAESLTGKTIQSWQEIAEQIVFLPFEKFQELAIAFKKESKRFTDNHAQVTGASPLHRGNPPTLHLTHQTMRFLATLDPQKFYVLPFQDPLSNGAAVLEVSPRSTLKCLGLPDSGYKSREKKDHDKMQSIRHKMLQALLNLKSQNGMRFKDCPTLILNKKLEHLVIEFDQAMDALIASFSTALFIYQSDVFSDPLSSDNLDVLLEGWIYEPSKLAT